jgi:hypothetical protein
VDFFKTPSSHIITTAVVNKHSPTAVHRATPF